MSRHKNLKYMIEEGMLDDEGFSDDEENQKPKKKKRAKKKKEQPQEEEEKISVTSSSAAPSKPLPPPASKPKSEQPESKEKASKANAEKKQERHEEEKKQIGSNSKKVDTQPLSFEKLNEVYPTIEEGLKQQEGVERLNVVIIGHVDSGKSTLMGHLLHKLGEIPKGLLHKFKRESEQIGKATFHFAWVLDQEAEEREHGVTINVGKKHFHTEKRSYTILDAPGHRDFVSNMIRGTAQADAAVLVIDSRKGEFEKGLTGGGQTKEHAVLARSLGVLRMIVAVNKLDLCDWEEERYKEIREKSEPHFLALGF